METTEAKKKKRSIPRARREVKEQGPTNIEALKILAKHFNSLKYELCTGLHINCRGETEEDIFCNTIIYVVHEKGISKKSETELLSHFKRRFNMMSFQTVQDNAAIHKHLTDNYHDVRNALYSKQ